MSLIEPGDPDSFPDFATLPQNGELADADGSADPAWRVCLDRTAYLQKTLSGGPRSAAISTLLIEALLEIHNGAELFIASDSTADIEGVVTVGATGKINQRHDPTAQGTITLYERVVDFVLVPKPSTTSTYILKDLDLPAGSAISGTPVVTFGVDRSVAWGPGKTAIICDTNSGQPIATMAFRGTDPNAFGYVVCQWNGTNWVVVGGAYDVMRPEDSVIVIPNGDATLVALGQETTYVFAPPSVPRTILLSAANATAGNRMHLTTGNAARNSGTPWTTYCNIYNGSAASGNLFGQLAATAGTTNRYLAMSFTFDGSAWQWTGGLPDYK